MVQITSLGFPSPGVTDEDLVMIPNEQWKQLILESIF